MSREDVIERQSWCGARAGFDWWSPVRDGLLVLVLCAGTWGLFVWWLFRLMEAK